MKAIWKINLMPEPKQTIDLPINATILTCKVQRGIPSLWFINHNTDDPRTEPRTIRVYGTGHQHDDIAGTYIATLVFQEQNLVLHIFEEPS